MDKYLRGLLPLPAQYHNQKPRLLTRKAEKRNCAMLMEAESGECLMITFLGAAHQMTRWIPPERCDHFCFYTEASFLVMFSVSSVPQPVFTITRAFSWLKAPTSAFTYKGLSIYYVSSYNKAGSFRMLTNAYLREQGFIQKLMSYENPN